MSFSVNFHFSTLYLKTLHNYTTTNTFDGLELQNVCENPKTHIQHLCKYKCYAKFSKHSKAMCSHNEFSNHVNYERKFSILQTFM